MDSTATDLGVGQARDTSADCFNLRQTITGKAGFIASSKNKTWKQTIVLSESDVYLSCRRPALCRGGSAAPVPKAAGTRGMRLGKPGFPQ